MARIDLDEQCPNWRIKETREQRILGVLYGEHATRDLEALLLELRAARAVVDATKGILAAGHNWQAVVVLNQQQREALDAYDKLINDGGE